MAEWVAPIDRCDDRGGGLVLSPGVQPLHREAAAFARLLTGEPARLNVVDAYVAAHESHPDLLAGTPFQRRLIATASRGVFRARIADGYARFFDPYGPLRRKLVLMLAILESTPPTHRLFDTPIGGSPAGAFVPLVAYGLRSVFCTLLGVILFMPLRWWFSRGSD